MKKPIICFDIDGTLLDPTGNLHPLDKKILTSQKGAVFIPCTGRPRDGVRSMFHDNGMFNNQNPPFAMVTQNGAASYLANGDLAQYNNFPPRVQEQMLEIFSDYPQTSFMLLKEDANFLLHPNDFGSYWMAWFNVPWEPFHEADRQLTFGKMTCLTEDEGVIQELSERLSVLPVEFGRSLKVVFDIQPRGISKRTGVEHLVHQLKLGESPIVCAGDGENDLELFEFSDYSFSPTTAVEHVRRQADEVIDVKKHGLLTPMLEKAHQL